MYIFFHRRWIWLPKITRFTNHTISYNTYKYITCFEWMCFFISFRPEPERPQDKKAFIHSVEGLEGAELEKALQKRQEHNLSVSTVRLGGKRRRKRYRFL